MKKFLLLTLIATLASFGSLASADDVTIAITKAGDTKAKVCTFGKDTPSSTVPISFDTDASWDVVKDSYTVSSDTAASLAAGTSCVSIGSDGTATFKKMCSAKKADAKAPAKK
jgi:hypothetical protein